MSMQETVLDLVNKTLVKKLAKKSFYKKQILFILALSVLVTACSRQTQTPHSSSNAQSPNEQSNNQNNNPQGTQEAELSAVQWNLMEQMVGTDIRDIKKYKGQEVLLADILIQDMLTRPQFYFPVGVTFSSSGVGMSSSSRVNSVYGVEMQSTPVQNADKSLDISLSAFIHEQKAGFFFRKWMVRLDLEKKQVLDIKNVEEISLSQTKFSIRVGLIQRKLILEDREYNIRKVFPLGVGGFDLGVNQKGVVTLMTPEMKNSETNVNQKFILASRLKPTYFEGRPFIRIFRQNDNVSSTSYAFHGKIESVLTRGFVSHGCMRMQDKDVFELFAITKYGPLAFIPTTISMILPDRIEHPYPLTNNRYNTVINFGSKDHPKAGRDAEGLTAMKTVREKAPIDLLLERIKAEEPHLSESLKQN